MSISSSLNAGVMGLAANASRLASISDNIANSATIGYKQSEVDFSAMVLNQGQSGYSAGGVSSRSYKNVDAEGALINTGNSTDIAIDGRGMLPVTDSNGLTTSAGARTLMLTPTGSFTPNDQGFMSTLSGLYLLGWPADASGNIPSVSRNSATGLEPVNVASNQFVASPTTSINLGVNLPSSATEAGATGAPYDLPVEYFNSLGSSETLTLSFAPTVPGAGASNAWTVSVSDSANPGAPIASFTIDFNTGLANGGTVGTVTAGAGAAYDAATGEVTVNGANGPISLYVGTAGSRDGLTQLDAAFSPTSVTKNGSPISELQSIEIDDKGMLEAVYESGLRRTLYQIPVADVPNMNGLKSQGNQAYSLSRDSGELYFWDSGTGAVGTTEGFTLMESTTDIAAELTDLIETQRAYSTNAKIVQTVDEMLQETTNLKR